jgi:hypothetical protein
MNKHNLYLMLPNNTQQQQPLNLYNVTNTFWSVLYTAW